MSCETVGADMREKLKNWRDGVDIGSVRVDDKLEHCIHSLENRSYLDPSSFVVPGSLTKGELYWALREALEVIREKG